MSRLTWVDHAKAFAMFLVVYGHSSSTAWGIGRWIYSFHIPLFFLLSGLLLRRHRLQEPFRKFLADTVRCLAPAYFAFAAIGFLAWLLVLRRFGADSDAHVLPLYRLLAVFYGTGKPDGFRIEPSVLWFFPCLFSSRLLVYWVYRTARMDSRRALGISGALSLVGFALPSAVALPLELDAALVAQIFVVLGFELHRHDVVERIGDASFGWVVALFAVGGCCAFLNGPVDMRVGRYDNVILYCGGSLATSLGLFLAVHGRAPNKVVEAIARNTIIIFPLHILVFSMFAALYVFVLHVPLAIRENAMVGFAASVANVAILVVMSPLFRKFFPWVYGAGGSRGPATIARPVEAAAR